MFDVDVGVNTTSDDPAEDALELGRDDPGEGSTSSSWPFKVEADDGVVIAVPAVKVGVKVYELALDGDLACDVGVEL